MKKHIALIGANGQLGTDMERILLQDNNIILLPLTHDQIEITNYESIQKTLDQIEPDIVINTAAYNTVDKAEEEPEKSYSINAIALKHLSQYCAFKKATLVHISTDYVFGLDKKRTHPYLENDPPGPVNSYGISKLAGEYFIRYLMTNYFIIRSSGLFGIAGSSGKGGNFIETIIKKGRTNNQIKVVDDQILTPTYTLDLAKQIAVLINTDMFGVYHATAEEQCSWYEFAKAIFNLTGIQTDLVPVSSKDFPLPAKRPSYSVLENEKIKKLDISTMRNWKEGLIDYLKEKNYISL